MRYNSGMGKRKVKQFRFADEVIDALERLQPDMGLDATGVASFAIMELLKQRNPPPAKKRVENAKAKRTAN